MVRNLTPIATPVVPAPEAKSIARPGQARHRLELVPPVSVITPLGDFELGQGSLLLGRLLECDINMEDTLVSRMHARISVQADRVVLEDLHSTNGVYVNGERIAHEAVLREGDRVLIGTTELSLFESRDSGPTRLRGATLEAPTSRAPRQPPVEPTSPPLAARNLGSAERIPSTTRTDALKMIGSLADRLAASGNLEEATQVLSGQLKRILKGANAGLAVLPEVAATASHHALTLARWTKLALWADYVVELHLSARLMMSEPTLASFDDVISKVQDFDSMLLSYYVDDQLKLRESLTREELKRLELLAQLAQLARRA